MDRIVPIYHIDISWKARDQWCVKHDVLLLLIEFLLELILVGSSIPLQTRGNQREIDRARSQKRNEKNGKKNSDGLTPLQRKERSVFLLHAGRLHPVLEVLTSPYTLLLIVQGCQSNGR